MYTLVRDVSLVEPDVLKDAIGQDLSDKLLSVSSNDENTTLIFEDVLTADETSLLDVRLGGITDESSLIFRKKTSIRRAINKKRNRKFFSDFEYKGVIFQGAKDDMENLKEAIATSNTMLIAKGIDPGTPDFIVNWILKDNTTIELNSIDMITLNMIMLQKKGLLWSVASSHKSAIMQINDLDLLDNYDYHAGW